MRSKGVSQIVASVLIVLIVLVASGMMWIVIQTFLSNTSDRVGGVDCFSAAVQPVSCVYDSDTRGVSVIVHRDLGVSSISGLNFVFSNSTGSFVNQKISDIQELETRNYTFYYPQNFIIPNQVDVSAKLGDLVCNPSQQPIICNEGDVAAEQNCNVHKKYACTTNDGKPGLKECLDGVDYGDCNVACGDGFVEPLLGEECDASDPNDPNKDKCTNECKLQADNGDWGAISTDCEALYSTDPNRGQLQFNLLDNGKSFEVVRGSDGFKLREKVNGEKFYAKKQGSPLVISYEFINKTDCGGVDIKYTITNPTNADVDMVSYLQIPGLKQTIDKDKKGWYLYPYNFGGLIPMRKNADGTFKSGYLGVGNDEMDHTVYPHSYSSAIAAEDDNFATGSSMFYEYLKDKNEVTMTLLKDDASSSWTHRYGNFDLGNDVYLKVPKNSNRVYTISLRFTKNESDLWIYTLTPYKTHFDEVYGAGANVPQKNLNPVRRFTLAIGQWNGVRHYKDEYTDPTGKYDIVNKGFGKLFGEMVATASAQGFKRVMLWKVSGLYNNPGYNFPPQFMDFIPDTPLTNPAEFKPFTDNFETLFWWGRSTQIPYKNNHVMTEDEWEPSTLQDANYSKNAHMDFLRNQLKKAVCDRHADGLGLDAFSNMPDYDRYKWVDDMKAYAATLKDANGASCGTPNLLLFGEGAQPDFIHSKIGNVYFPCKHVNLPGVDILSHFLNPRSEIQVDFATSFKDPNGILICSDNYNDNLADSKFEVQKHTKWGYTRYTGDIKFNVGELDVREAQCMDGKENELGNNKDGKIDYPFDPNCSSFADDSE